MRGIVSFQWFHASEDYKDLLLPFDTIYVPRLSELLNEEPESSEEDEKVASIAWLAEQGFLLEPTISVLDEEFESDDVVEGLADQYLELDRLSDEAREQGDETLAEFQQLVAADIYLSRGCSYLMWRENEELVVPIVFPYDIDDSPMGARSEVLSVVMSEFPTPSESIPLEDLISFKRDPETQYKFGLFQDWIRRVATEELSQFELSEEVESLLRDYRYHVNRIDRDMRAQRTELLVTAPFDILQNVTRLKFGDALRRVFALRHVTVSAHEKELKSPGSELAYIQEAVDRFA